MLWPELLEKVLGNLRPFCEHPRSVLVLMTMQSEHPPEVWRPVVQEVMLENNPEPYEAYVQLTLNALKAAVLKDKFRAARLLVLAEAKGLLKQATVNNCRVALEVACDAGMAEMAGWLVKMAHKSYTINTSCNFLKLDKLTPKQKVDVFLAVLQNSYSFARHYPLALNDFLRKHPDMAREFFSVISPRGTYTDEGARIRCLNFDTFCDHFFRAVGFHYEILHAMIHSPHEHVRPYPGVFADIAVNPTTDLAMLLKLCCCKHNATVFPSNLIMARPDLFPTKDVFALITRMRALPPRVANKPRCTAIYNDLVSEFLSHRYSAYPRDLPFHEICHKLGTDETTLRTILANRTRKRRFRKRCK